MNFDRVMQLFGELDRFGVEYVVVGGVALNYHGLVRATEDVNLFVRPTEDNVARLRRALRAVWADPEVDIITAADLAGNYPTVRYGPPAEDFVVDILSRLESTFRFYDIEAEMLVIDGIPVRVATPGMLFRMKSGRSGRSTGPTPRHCGKPLTWRRSPMAVTRFTSLDEARRELFAHPADALLAARIRLLWSFAGRLVPAGTPQGIARFQSIEEANAARAAWVKRRAQALRAGGAIRSTRRA